MTLDVQRMRAIQSARDFLRGLLDPAKTQRVPSKIREEARRILKHYPEPYWIDDKLPKESCELREEDAGFCGKERKSHRDEL